MKNRLESVIIDKTANGYDIAIQDDLTGSAVGFSMSEEAHEQLRLHFVMLSLPSDEEISIQAKQKYPYKKTKEGTYYEGKSKGYAEGANWMKFQIEKLNEA